MTYEEWLTTVPPELTGDPLWKMKVYRLAVFVGDLAWRDVSKLLRDQRTKSLADQLYRAVGSIGANISEGYSRRSGKDRARFYEYAMGSAREARGWYYQGRHILTEEVCTHRAQLLTEIIRLLLTITPATRTHNLAEERAPYEVSLSALLKDPPIS
jgi:four helix bundle protein